MMKKILTILTPALVLFIFIISISTCKQLKDSVAEELAWVEEEEEEPDNSLYYHGIRIDSLHITDYPIKSGDNLAKIFIRHGFSAAEADKISKSISEVLDPTKLRAGMNYTLFTPEENPEDIHYISFAKSRTDFAVIDFTQEEISAYEYIKPVTLKRHYAEGILNSSLWSTLKAGGSDPFLAVKMSDVFAWQIDFFDVKEGDSFKVIYDVAYIDDTTALNIASIEGAVFNHRGKDFVAIPFTQDSVTQYFDAEGNSLRKAFLKAPLDFFRITSRFTNARFHPILKRYRAHHGVDYAAPVGTPVKTIGDGTVIAKGYEGGGGNYIKVKHNSVYTTSYMHLSKFAAGLQVGSRVRQGDVIGYVGSTGLSTGPHLDFRVYKNGQAIDPLKMDAPPSEPIKPEMEEYFALTKSMIYNELDSFQVVYAKAAAEKEKNDVYKTLLSMEETPNQRTDEIIR